MNTVEQMRLFMEPKSVAFIGVPRDTGEGSNNVVENLVNYGFSGEIYPVNPKAEEILGIRAYPSITNVLGTIDLAVIATPRSAVLSALNECIEKNIRAIVIVAGGFADAGEDGKKLQAKITRIAKNGGTRILGPNSLGVANAFCNLSTAFLPLAVKKIPVGTICQTGMLFAGTPRFVLTGKTIDLANCCDIDFADGLEYFEDDPEIKLVALYIEGIQNGARFVEVAGRVARKKPILALKAGRSQLGAKTAQSHTGSMAGRDEVYDTVFKQCGIIRARDTDEVEDLSKAFLNLPLMKGRRIGIATISYAAGTLVVDACEEWNLDIAQLSSQTVEKIQRLYPAWLPVRNPIDMAPASTTAEGLRNSARISLEALLSDEQVDGVVFIVGAIPQQKAFLCTEIVSQVAEVFKDKPIVTWLVQPDVNREVAIEYDNTGKTVVYPTCRRAVRVLARLAERYEFLNDTEA